MSSFRCQAFSLRTYPFGEANKIAVFLTREMGIVRGVAYGARHSSSRFGSALEPLTQIELSFRQKENQELAVIQNCEIVRGLPAQRLSWEENLHFSYFVELLIEFGTERQESENLFRLTKAVLGAVGRVPIDLLARYFELWILKLEGYLPPLEQTFPADLAPAVADLMRRPPREISSKKLNINNLSRLERVTEELIQYHLEKPLKSRKMLRELL